MKFALLLTAALAAAPFANAQAQLDRAEAGAYRIDLAGSMRMRTQRMLRNACYVAMDVDVEGNGQALNADIAAMTETHATLLDGNEEIGLGAERSPIIRRELSNIAETNWAQYQIYPLYIAARGYAEGTELEDMARISGRLVEEVNGLVASMEEKYSRASVLPADQSRTLNVMGRQRMLSQLLAAQHCLLAQSEDPMTLQGELAATFATLVGALADLRTGNLDNRIVEPMPEVATVLNCAHETFTGISAIVQSAIMGETPDAAKLAEMQRLSDQMMAQSNEALQMATALFSGGESIAVQSCTAT